jgi:MurNAc alpha-1-phosphate uridylyltransferase
MKAILFAAGLGTRLKPFTNHRPKALVEVNNKTLLERNIIFLRHFGIKDVIINVHHFAAMIEDAIKQNNGFGSNITISDERDQVLETGGGLKKAAPFFQGEETFVIMNADVLTNLNLAQVIAHHRQGGAMATLAVMRRNSSRQFLFDPAMQLCGWANNSTHEQRISRVTQSVKPFAFSGIQVVSHKLLGEIRSDGKFSLVDVYLDVAKTHKITGYDHTGDLFIDVGKPESIEVAENFFP